MIKFKRTADLYYDEQGNLVACVSRRVMPTSEHDVGVEFIPNGVGLQELLNELTSRDEQGAPH